MRRWTVLSSLAVALAAPLAQAATGEENRVDVALVLAVDVSRSMDFDEQLVQRNGYVAAFRHPEVLAAIASGPYGRIAVTYIEWAGAPYQNIVVPWRIIAGEEDALSFSDDLTRGRLTSETSTSISGALRFAWDALDQLPYPADRRTVDVSGDGANNDGPPVAPMRDRLVADGITINGLPILIRPSNLFGRDGTVRLEWYYEDCVIGGPGAFLVTVNSIDQFEGAIRRKLVLEIAAISSLVVPVAESFATHPPVDCLIGERLRRAPIDPTQDPFSPLYRP